MDDAGHGLRPLSAPPAHSSRETNLNPSAKGKAQAGHHDLSRFAAHSHAADLLNQSVSTEDKEDAHFVPSLTGTDF